MHDPLLHFMRRYRIVSAALTIFALYWGYDAYLFMNTHFKGMPDFVVLFYTSIVALGGWCIKNWMTTSASPPLPAEQSPPVDLNERDL